MILAVGGAKSFVRLADLRVLVERVFTLASRNNRIATTEIFEELLAVYADGAALETWTISGTTGTTRPLIHSIFERAGAQDSIQSRPVHESNCRGVRIMTCTPSTLARWVDLCTGLDY